MNEHSLNILCANITYMVELLFIVLYQPLKWYNSL